MTRRAGALNRFWLGLLGLLLVLTGAAGLVVATGQARRLVGSTVPLPTPDDQVVVVPSQQLTNPLVLIAIAAAGVLLAVLAIVWLVAQLPRSGRSSPYRISDDASAGLTTVSARVLADAVEQDVLALAGVESADVVVRGSAAAPELVLTVTASTDAELARLLTELSDGVPARFADAVGAPVCHVGVKLDLRRERTGSDRMIVA